MNPSTSPRYLPRCSRRLLLAVLAAGSVLLAGTAGAIEPIAGLAALEVVDRDSGQVLPTYTRHGQRYVPGHPGARYALRVRNLTANRVLVVLSVDGVNVISGQTAEWSQTGYVLEPGRWHDINGWRKSESEIAAFEFAPIERSYAARTGRPDHVGVIGMAVFRERPPTPPPVAMAPPVPMRSESRPGATARPAPAPTAAAAPGAAALSKATEDNASGERAPERGARLGTGHGQREWSVSRRTSFERASPAPDQLTQIEYDSVERLVSAGVIPAPRPISRPSPFPASPMAFAPDPPR